MLPPPRQTACWIALLLCASVHVTTARMTLGFFDKFSSKSDWSPIKWMKPGDNFGSQSMDMSDLFGPRASATGGSLLPGFSSFPKFTSIFKPSSSSGSTPAPAPTPGSTSPSGSSGSGPSDSALKAVLDFHNQVRATHGASPLTWNAQMAASAASYSQRCALQHSTSDERGGAGENLAKGHETFLKGAEAWYAERSQYTGSYSSGTGHFTQMVWRASKELGCGYTADCRMYVCRYAPAGNVLGQFQQNVG